MCIGNKSNFVLMLLLAAGTLTAGKILVKEGAEDEDSGVHGGAKISSEAWEGKKAYLVEKTRTIISKKKFSIDPEKYYISSVWVKAVGNEPSFGYLGIIPFDTQNRFIGHHNINTMEGTFTELAAPCQATDKIVRIKNGSRWEKGKYLVIAFNASEDESDLPNFNVTATEGIENIEEKDGVYELTLKKPVGKEYPAGTRVREHRCGPSFVYDKQGKIPTEWTKWQGKPRKGDQFRRAAVTGQAVLICNDGDSKDKAVLFDDLMIEEVDDPTQTAATGSIN